MLADVTNQPDLSPFRLHLHRAPTDNDKYGYLPRWEALGNNNNHSTNINTNTKTNKYQCY